MEGSEMRGFRAAAAALAFVGLTGSSCNLSSAVSEVSAGIEAACADVTAAAAAFPTSPVIPWARGACGTATAVAGLAQNAATIQWLGTIQAQLAKPA